MDTQQPPPQHPRSHLFTVRLWVEVLGCGRAEVRMQVRHVISGETRYFRDGSLLLSYLLTKMHEVECESETDAEIP